MDKIQPVILCGNSVFMSGLALTLESQGAYPVLRAANLKEVLKILPMTRPVAILVDSSANQQWFENLVGQCPDTPIIAVSSDNSAAIVHTHATVSNVNDLVEVIKEAFAIGGLR